VRRLLISTVLALALWAPLAPAIQASEDWCSSDPVEVIITSGNFIVPVYVTNSALGVEHLPSASAAQISYTASTTGNGTLVKMTVVVPNDAFGSNYPTASLVSLGPDGTSVVLAQTTGISCC
jgi:hypothetical protein